MTAHKQQADRQNDRVQEWLDAKPTAPRHRKPGEPGDWVVNLGMMFVFIGAILGVVIFIFGFSTPEPTQDEESFHYSAPMIGASAGVIIAVAIYSIQWGTYWLRFHLLGWSKYHSDMKRWKLIGDEDFGEWAKSNLAVASKLSIISDSYLQYFQANYANDDAPKSKEYIDDELGELEHRLDNAVPGPSSELIMPSDETLERSAKRYARSKKKFIAQGERFLVETSFKMRRTIGPNSDGWLCSGNLSPEEQAWVSQHVKAIYEAQGLRVTKCRFEFTGMTDSASHGTYESLELVVRLA